LGELGLRRRHFGRRRGQNGPATAQARPRLYAEVIAEDRRLRLSGYEVYRFGDSEFLDRNKVGIMLTSLVPELLQL
jgi:hypothetical protein